MRVFMCLAVVFLYFVTFATVLDYCMCLTVRYVVVLNGKEAIHDALIKHSLKFSDRPQYYTNTDVLNIHAKGKCCLLFCLCQSGSFSTRIGIYIICNRTCNEIY